MCVNLTRLCVLSEAMVSVVATRSLSSCGAITYMVPPCVGMPQMTSSTVIPCVLALPLRTVGNDAIMILGKYHTNDSTSLSN